MTIELYNEDNLLTLKNLYLSSRQFDIIYGDCIYESNEFLWTNLSYEVLKTNGVFILQTDWHSVAEYKVYLDRIFGKENFINWLVWKNEFGNFPKNKFHQCHDDILIYAKGKDYKFYPEKIQVPKATANTKLNPSGRLTKTATSWIDDICLTTTSKERIKLGEKNIKWQKPRKLFDRIISPFTDSGDYLADVFMGSGTLGIWCKENNINYVGIELEKQRFDLASKLLEIK